MCFYLTAVLRYMADQHSFLVLHFTVGCHFLLQGIFPSQGLNQCPTLQADALISAPPGNQAFKNQEDDSDVSDKWFLCKID